MNEYETHEDRWSVRTTLQQGELSYFDYGYENYLWIHDDMDYDEENNYRINLMKYFDTRNCLNRRLRNCYRRRNRYESKLMILTTKKMLPVGSTERHVSVWKTNIASQSKSTSAETFLYTQKYEGYRMVGLSVIVY